MKHRTTINHPRPTARPAGLAAALDRWTCPALTVLLAGVVALLVFAYRRNVRLRTELAAQTQRLHRFVAARDTTAPGLAAQPGLATSGSGFVWVNSINADAGAAAGRTGL